MKCNDCKQEINWPENIGVGVNKNGPVCDSCYAYGEENEIE